MAKALDLLARMRSNPAADWTIRDVETVCKAAGVACLPPKRGDHYKIAHPSQVEILTIPAARPIKPVYIRKLAKFIESVLS